MEIVRFKFNENYDYYISLFDLRLQNVNIFSINNN